MKHKRICGRARQAFTLIELLTVIAIIGVLAGLLPAVAGARNRARKTKAKAAVTSLAAAIQGFYVEYGKVPAETSEQGTADYWYDAGAKNKNVIKALIGLNPTINPKGSVFLEGASIVDDGTFLDPWKNEYRFKLDTDYDNWIEYYGTNTVIGLAVSYGPNKAQEDPEDGDDLVSYR